MRKIPPPDATIPREQLDNFVVPSDVGFGRGDRWYSKAIRWFTRAPGEEPTYTNHTFGFGPECEIVEALFSVKRMPLTDWRPPAEFEIWRHMGLLPQDRARIALTTARKEGRVYGGFKILAHLGDSLLTKILAPRSHNIHLFRRLCFLPRYPICSWLWGWAYEHAGWTLSHCPARYATPDDQHDWVTSNHHWELIAHKRKGGPIEIWIPKLERFSRDSSNTMKG